MQNLWLKVNLAFYVLIHVLPIPCCCVRNLLTAVHLSVQGFLYMRTTGYCYRPIKTFLTDRFRVTRHTSSKRRISAAILHSSKLALFYLLIYLHNWLKTNPKLLAGKISLFTVINEKTWGTKLMVLPVTFIYSIRIDI